jgi:hypothetical protein
MFKSLCLIALLAACTACAPVPQHRYVADVPEDSLVYAYCPMNKRVPVGALFTVDDIHATVGLFRAGDRDYVEVQFDVPPGKTLTLQSDVLKLTHGSVTNDSVIPNVSMGNYRIEDRYKTSPSVQNGMVPATTPMIGGRVGQGAYESDKHYWLAAYVDAAKADDVWVTLPPFTINDTPTRIEPIHFKRRIIVIIAMINC